MVGALLLIASSFPLLSLIQLRGPTFDGALLLIGAGFWRPAFGSLYCADRRRPRRRCRIYRGILCECRPEGNKGVMRAGAVGCLGCRAIAAAATRLP
jgi:hypothetical protein